MPAWIVEEGRHSYRLARLCKGVVAELVEGRLKLQHLLKRASHWIYTSWYGIKDDGTLSGEELQREIQRQYAPREVAF